MAAVPSELNAGTVLRATNDQLRYWIEEANRKAELEGPMTGKKKKKVLTKGGKKEELQRKLAAYYGFDLSVDVVPLPAGPLTIDTDIQIRQWVHLRSLGQEWREEAHAGHPFLLYTPLSDADIDTGDPRTDRSQDGFLHLSLLQEIQQVLGSLKGLAACTGTPLEAGLEPGNSTSAVFPEGMHIANETAYALMGAALRGNVKAISDLQQLLAQRMGMSMSAAPAPMPGASHGTSSDSSPQPPTPASIHVPPMWPSHPSSPSTIVCNTAVPAAQAVPTLTLFGRNGLDARPTDFASAVPSSLCAPTTPSRPSPCPTVSVPGSSDLRRMPEATATATATAAAEVAHACELDSEASVLDACKAEVLALRKASGLRDVIKQVEAGVVQQMRDRYGPPVGHRGASSPTWDHVKGTVTRRERLYHQFKTEFDGDEDRFFGFFTLNPPRKRRQNGSGTDWDLRALRRVVEAIPWMLEDVEEEMKLPEYVDPSMGTFSHELWSEKWGSTANTWEIWRMMGKERYVRVTKD